MPKLTIAIPTHNRQDYLPDLLKSIQAQSFKDFEVLVFDDMSSYDVQALLNTFSNLPTTLIKSQEALGNVGNFGRIMVHGYSSEYLLVFHDDDVMHPRLLEREVEVLDNYPGAVFVGTGLQFIHNHKNIFNFAYVPHRIEATLYKSPTDLLREWLRGFPYCFGSTMYRVNKIRFDPAFSQPLYTWHDRPYLLTLAEQGSAAVIKQPLVNYRIHSAQVSQEKINEQHLQSIHCMMEIFKSFLPQPLSYSDEKLFFGMTSYGILSFFLQRGERYPELQKHFSDPLVKLSALNFKQWFMLFKMYISP